MKLIARYYGFSSMTIFVLLAVLTGPPLRAATHIVKFGGSAGFKYVPASFSAAIGDTIKWEGDFTVHPLSSTTIPAGSQSWHVSSGSSFSYVIAVPGVYHYKCDVHSGMTGDFQAGATGISHPVRQIDPPNTSTTNQIIDLAGRAVLPKPTLRQGGYPLPSAGKQAIGIHCIRLIFNNKEKVVKSLSLR